MRFRSRTPAGDGGVLPRLVATHPLLTILVLAVLVRVAYFVVFAAGSEDPLELGGGDGQDYWLLGTHLRDELSFDEPTFVLRPPAWPGLIALGLILLPGDSEWLPIAFNVLLSLAIVPLTYLLARLLGLSERIALLAALIMAVEPTSARMAMTAMSEPLFVVAFVGAIVLALAAARSPDRTVVYAILSGLAAGLALLVKPSALGLGVVLAILIVVSFRRELRPRVVAAAIALAVISLAPYFLWTYSNQQNLGVSTFSSAGDWNLYFIRGTGVLRRATGAEPTEIEQDLADRISIATGAIPGSRTAADYLTTTSPEALDQMRERAIDIFGDHPGWFLAMYAVGGVKLFFEPQVNGALVPAFVVAHAILYLLALLGLTRLWGHRRSAFWPISLLLAFYVLGTTTVQSSGTTRLLMPLIPLIAVTAAVGLQSVILRIRGAGENERVAAT